MLPLFHGTGCIPFTPTDQPCSAKAYAAYSINVASADDVTAGLKFAKENNIRLTIKNTGHDFLGRSTGSGALNLWVYNLKDITFKDYNSSAYSGPAITLGTGVQGYEAYAAAHAKGYRVVGGDCGTVAPAGGYTQGGGHSLLSSTYGLAADQVLEWEVVTADGQHLVASPSQNSDLYWALSGGGAGTYAVVLSMTSKLYPDGNVGGANMTFSAPTENNTIFWTAVEQWQSSLASIVDAGGYAVYIVTAKTFTLQVLTLPGGTDDDVSVLLSPFLSHLRSTNLTYAVDTTDSPTYYDHYVHYLGPLPDGPYTNNELIGGRFIPRSVATSNVGAVTAAIRDIVADSRYVFNGLAVNANHSVAGNTPASNAVHPGWRDALLSAIVQGTWNQTAPWESNVATETKLTDELIPLLDEITPGAGAYMNEADVNNPNWKEDYFGENYERLRSIKASWDPEDLLYAKTTVGSDEWGVDEEGRLCKV
ncbi:FAD-linked oxidoreductase patO [Lasiodiplodia hormozganensis]|uniref:FAD-linked oxidoreductase patO n=1 Tax=Lasiodiplodia hormozganensis TaxID=869390 RepID=A0AA40CG80_9PEZI|nr:FAD-linked oxidoreductase patO [Lasiodiplodia hormozganensis]